MNQLKAHYDRFLVVAAGLLLAAAALFVLVDTLGLSERFVLPSPVAQGKKFNGARHHLAKHFNSHVQESGVFASRGGSR